MNTNPPVYTYSEYSYVDIDKNILMHRLTHTYPLELHDKLLKNAISIHKHIRSNLEMAVILAVIAASQVTASVFLSSGGFSSVRKNCSVGSFYLTYDESTFMSCDLA